MSTHSGISDTAAQARESARQTDGKFGAQEPDEVAGGLDALGRYPTSEELLAKQLDSTVEWADEALDRLDAVESTDEYAYSTIRSIDEDDYGTALADARAAYDTAEEDSEEEAEAGTRLEVLESLDHAEQYALLRSLSSDDYEEARDEARTEVDDDLGLRVDFDEDGAAVYTKTISWGGPNVYLKIETSATTEAADSRCIRSVTLDGYWGAHEERSVDRGSALWRLAEQTMDDSEFRITDSDRMDAYDEWREKYDDEDDEDDGY